MGINRVPFVVTVKKVRFHKRGMRLGTFDEHYKRRNSIKGHVLVDFMAKFTPPPQGFIGICQVTVKQWKVFVDGASNARGSRVGIVLVSLEGVKLEKSLRLGFQASNNKTKYEALIARM